MHGNQWVHISTVWRGKRRTGNALRSRHKDLISAVEEIASVRAPRTGAESSSTGPHGASHTGMHGITFGDGARRGFERSDDEKGAPHESGDVKWCSTCMASSYRS